MRQILLQNATAILLQNATGITKCEVYYKLQQYIPRHEIIRNETTASGNVKRNVPFGLMLWHSN